MKAFEIHLIRSVIHALSRESKALLPGLGVLKVESIASGLTDEKTVHPPSRSMSFLANDGQAENLSGFFTDQLGMDAAEVKAEMSSYFDQLKTDIKDAEVEWHGLGKFYTDAGGRTQFRAADQWVNFLNPGFEPVKRAPQDDPPKAAVAATATTAAEPLKTGLGTTPSSASSETNRSEASKGWMSWVWMILTLLVLSIGLIAVAKMINKKAAANDADRLAQEEQSSSLIMTDSDSTSHYVHQVSHSEVSETLSSEENNLEGEEPEETQSDEISAPVTSTAPLKEAKQEIREVVKPAPKASSGGCVVVAGAFGSKANADAFERKLSKTYDNTYNQLHGKLNRVGVRCNCARANQVGNSLKSDLGIDTWSFKL